jgi:hypothetical protein
MRLPSIKTIAKFFPHLIEDDVKEVRNILENYCHRPIACLEELNPVLDGCGIEYIADVADDQHDCHGLEYINMGDTYDSTFIYDHRTGRLFISCWGDEVEKNYRRFGYDT